MIPRKIIDYIFCLILFFLIAIGSASGQSHYKLTFTKEASIIGGGLALSGIYFFMHDNTEPLNTVQIGGIDRSSINRFDRAATFNYSLSANDASDVLVAASIALPSVFMLKRETRHDWQTLSMMYFETALFATIIPQIAKKSFERVRPFVYNPKVPLAEKLTADARDSFFSGHTTWAFASAVFISTVYDEYFPSSRWRTYVWGGSILMAGTIGYLRYDAGYHFPTDIITGAAVGAIIGYVIPAVHKSNQNNVELSTSYLKDGGRLTVIYKW
ncbi:MAG: phosphatase PAP2 family protein [Ignavibacteriales bacterium]|nr:phosphatase PAP2 family protein [Ignavibacteriales bacterium]